MFWNLTACISCTVLVLKLGIYSDGMYEEIGRLTISLIASILVCNSFSVYTGCEIQ